VDLPGNPRKIYYLNSTSIQWFHNIPPEQIGVFHVCTIRISGHVGFSYSHLRKNKFVKSGGARAVTSPLARIIFFIPAGTKPTFQKGSVFNKCQALPPGLPGHFLKGFVPFRRDLYC
jgi:hypothetical protein